MADDYVGVRQAASPDKYIDNETAANTSAPGGVASRQRVAVVAPGGGAVATGAGQDAIVSALGSLLTELAQKVEDGGTVSLSAASLAALESISAVVSGTVALDASTLAALESINAIVSGTVSTSVRQKKHVEFVPSSAAPTTIYTGTAPVGTSDAAASWTIQRFVFTGATNIDETWSAAGSAVWNDRASTVYS